MASQRPHGTPGRYAHGPDEHDEPGHGCRCTPCTKAASKSRERYRLAAMQGRGIREVDVAPVRDHVLWLIGQRMNPLTIARGAGVSHSLITRLVHGDPRTRKPMKRIRDRNADAVLSVLPGNVSGLLVPIIGPQRRVRGLAYQGWPRSVVADRSGLAEQQVWWLSIADPGPTVRAATARRVEVATSRLWMSDPIAAGIEPWRVALARKRATAAGWVSLLAWDDIDDPAAVPNVGERSSRDQALAEDATELIRGQGYTPQHAAERLGVTVSRLQHALRREAHKQVEAVDV